jgi:hypothetical protein
LVSGVALALQLAVKEYISRSVAQSIIGAIGVTHPGGSGTLPESPLLNGSNIQIILRGVILFGIIIR